MKGSMYIALLIIVTGFAGRVSRGVPNKIS